MTILGIETSCDETSAAIIKKEGQTVTLLSNVIASSLALHQQTGGIIPENAAREQVKYILPVIQQALSEAKISPNPYPLDPIPSIDAIAVTYGPGLIGSLLVGVETAKTLAFVLNKPIIPINHMVGHIYANFIHEKSNQQSLTPSPYPPDPNVFPALALVVSGGHTDLLLMKGHGDFTLLGGTRDDAAGEAFDKIGRLLGLDYPAGPLIEKLAKQGDPKRFHFPRPLIGSPDYDFSFSGLKTAVLREVQKLSPKPYTLNPNDIADICRATQDAIIDVLVKKIIKATNEYQVKSILLSGGVAANETLRKQLERDTRRSPLDAKIFAPAKKLCTDNAAMVAAAAAYNFYPVPWQEITANPELYFD